MIKHCQSQKLLAHLLKKNGKPASKTKVCSTLLAFLKKKIENSIYGQGLDTFDDNYLDNDCSHY